MFYSNAFLYFGAAIGAALTALWVPGAASRSPCFTPLFSVATQASHTPYACVSDPRYRCDDGLARIGVYRQHVLQYKFDVTDFDNQLYLVTPNGTFVAELYLAWRPVAGLAAAPPGPAADSMEQALRLRLFDHGQYHSTWQLPADLPLALPESWMLHRKGLRQLGRRLYLDDSCLYLRHREGRLCLHLLKHTITRLPPDAGKPSTNLRAVLTKRSSPYAPLWGEGE